MARVAADPGAASPTSVLHPPRLAAPELGTRPSGIPSQRPVSLSPRLSRGAGPPGPVMAATVGRPGDDRTARLFHRRARRPQDHGGARRGWRPTGQVRKSRRPPGPGEVDCGQSDAPERLGHEQTGEVSATSFSRQIPRSDQDSIVSRTTVIGQRRRVFGHRFRERYLLVCVSEWMLSFLGVWLAYPDDLPIIIVSPRRAPPSAAGERHEHVPGSSA